MTMQEAVEQPLVEHECPICWSPVAGFRPIVLTVRRGEIVLVHADDCFARVERERPARRLEVVRDA